MSGAQGVEWYTLPGLRIPGGLVQMAILFPQQTGLKYSANVSSYLRGLPWWDLLRAIRHRSIIVHLELWDSWALLQACTEFKHVLGLTVRGTIGLYASLCDMLSQDLKVPKCHVGHIDKEGQRTMITESMH